MWRHTLGFSPPPSFLNKVSFSRANICNPGHKSSAHNPVYYLSGQHKIKQYYHLSFFLGLLFLIQTKITLVGEWVKSFYISDYLQ